MIFIVTNKEDAHPTPVIAYLDAYGVPVFRLNTEALLTDYEFRWWCNEGEADFYIQNVAIEGGAGAWDGGAGNLLFKPKSGHYGFCQTI